MMMIIRIIVAAVLLALPIAASAAGGNGINTKRGHAEIDRRLAAEFLGQGQATDEIVAFAYREHPKSAPAGPDDRCAAAGITWAGDGARDSIYVTSMLTSAAELEVKVGAVDTVVALPVRQAAAGGQVEIPIGNAVGRPSFTLRRNGEVIASWFGRLEIVSNPPIRNLSTYSDFQIVSDAAPSARFEPVYMDAPEGAPGETTNLVARVVRTSGVGAMTAICDVIAGTATASDFVGGVLPQIKPALPAGVLERAINIPVRGDSEQEGDEMFTLRCHDVLPATIDALSETNIEGVIRNDDAGIGAPTFTITALDPAITEGTGGTPVQQRFQISRTGDIATAASEIDFCLKPAGSGSSASASDFVGGWSAEIVPFGPGVTTEIRSVAINPDNIPEPTERYLATLQNPSAGSVVAVGEAEASIVDDDLGGGDVRINAGGASDVFVDSEGKGWSTDIGSGGAVDGNAFDYSGTIDDTLFQTYRYGASTYVLSGSAGKSYRVVGYFSEPDALARTGVTCPGGGKRRIQAIVTAENGARQTSEIDAYCAVGVRAAHIVQIGDVVAPTGKVTVEFRAATGSQAVPLVNAVSMIEYQPNIAPRPYWWLDLGALPTSTFTDGGGNEWQGAPQAFEVGCNQTTTTGQPEIDGTTSDPLFWTACRGRDMIFTVPIDGDPGDERSLSLFFSEPSAPVGARLADIYVGNVLQIANLDVRAVAGALNSAVVRVVSPVVVRQDGTVQVRVVAKTAADALINAMAVTETVGSTSYNTTIGWKGARKVDKRAIIEAVSPTGLSPAGNRLEVRGIDTTATSLYACHGACDESSTRGVQPDTTASALKPKIEILAHDPADADVSLFPSLPRLGSVDETFPVKVVEVLPDGTTGAETTVNVIVRVRRAF